MKGIFSRLKSVDEELAGFGGERFIQMRMAGPRGFDGEFFDRAVIRKFQDFALYRAGFLDYKFEVFLIFTDFFLKIIYGFSNFNPCLKRFERSCKMFNSSIGIGRTWSNTIL